MKTRFSGKAWEQYHGGETATKEAVHTGQRHGAGWKKRRGGDSIQDKYYTFLNINLMCTEPKVKN